MRSKGCVALVVLLAFAGCLERPTLQTCPEDLLCGDGLRCDPGSRGCVFVEQLTSCEGAAELASCAYPGVDDGACYDGVCRPAGCGNGTLDPTEVCDDGNRLHGDGCAADCGSNETCGNGFVDVGKGESCDPGGSAATWKGCRANCVTEICGDGIVDTEQFEECDDGAANSDAPDAACRPSCKGRFCGDGIEDLVAGEQCDDGNFLPGDGCSGACRFEVCGNAILDVVQDAGGFIPAEACDDGNSLELDGCASVCELVPSRWERPASPPLRSYAAMAYDAGRGRVVMFGGLARSPDVFFRDVWEWDGAEWTEKTPAVSPPGRYAHAMTYDAARGVVVMFGGTDDTNVYGDTWTWDGVAWTDATPVSGSPPARTTAALAYDAARDEVILFGGRLSGLMAPAVDDTWRWNGAAWTQLTVTGSVPPALRGPRMAFDAARGKLVLLASGSDMSGFASRTWEWDGAAWTFIANMPDAAAREDAAFAYDAVRGRVTLFGGGPVADTWEWDGTTWTDVTPAAGSPSVRGGHAMAFDTARGVLVMFGGSDSNVVQQPGTWERSGLAWSEITVTTPGLRTASALAYDAARGRVVMFGGQGPTSANVASTWEWDGRRWMNATPAAGSPEARRHHALAYDAARARVVMFGGRASNTPTLRDDTWTWNGTAWTNVTPVAGSPTARELHALSYDAARDRVVLFGGVGSDNAPLAETWEWDGTAWLPRASAAATPPPRTDHTLGTTRRARAP